MNEALIPVYHISAYTGYVTTQMHSDQFSIFINPHSALTSLVNN